MSSSSSTAATSPSPSASSSSRSMSSGFRSSSESSALVGSSRGELAEQQAHRGAHAVSARQTQTKTHDSIRRHGSSSSSSTGTSTATRHSSSRKASLISDRKIYRPRAGTDSREWSDSDSDTEADGDQVHSNGHRKVVPRLLKVVVVGENGTGKSNLKTRFVHDEFTLGSKPSFTSEFESTPVIIDHHRVTLQLWDSAKRQYYTTVTSVLLHGAIGGIVVYDITKYETFAAVETWLTYLRGRCANEIVIMILGNKCDLANLREVSEAEGRALAERHHAIFFEVSALTPTNVEEAFLSLAKASYELKLQQTLAETESLSDDARGASSASPGSASRRAPLMTISRSEASLPPPHRK